MDIILIAGLWLRATVWDSVVTHLRDLGLNPVPLELPGVDDGSATATLEDQAAAVLEAVDAADRPVVVGHSAAAGLAWIAADRRPDAIARVVMVGGFPGANGTPYADFFEPVDGLMPFPGWEPFEGPDSADLDEAARDRLVAQTVPVPEGVSKGVVRLSDERRYAVPITLVCPEFSADDAREWIEADDLPELAAAHDLALVDLDSGHWPMVSQPEAFARILREIATG